MSVIRTNEAAQLDSADEAAVRRAISTTPRPPRASSLSAALTFAWRGVLKVKHVPEQLTDATIMPVMFVLMFTYMMGGAITGSTSEYRDYLVPGILVMSLLFNTVYSGTTINVDLTKGVIERFRSLPVARSAPLLGSMLGDGVRYLIGGTVIIVVGVILGYRPGAGVGGTVSALALVVLFAFGLSWALTALGLVLRSPNAVMSAGFTILFPLTFLSNVFVPPQTPPCLVRAFGDVNPVSTLPTRCRGLMGGSAQAGDIALVAAVGAGLAAVFMPVPTRLYPGR